MPPIVDQGTYYKRYGDYFDSINEYYSLRGEDPTLELPEPVEITQDETEPSPEDLGYALFAKDSYKPIDERRDFNNYQYLKEDSTNRIGVYKSDIDNEIVYAIKGTDEEEGIQNFFRNTAIGMGGPITQYVDPTYQRYKKHVKETHEKYSNYKPIIVGHSQGGTYAGLLGTENPNYTAITYNMGTGFVPTGGDIKCLFNSCDNIKNYRIAGDWASSNLLTRPFLLRPKKADKELVEQGEKAERFFLPSEVFIPHGINQFIDRKPDDLKDDYGTYGRKIAGRVAGIGAALGVGAVALAELTATAPVAGALEAEVAPAVETALLPEGRLASDIATKETMIAQEKEVLQTVEDTEKMFKELVEGLPKPPKELPSIPEELPKPPSRLKQSLKKAREALKKVKGEEEILTTQEETFRPVFGESTQVTRQRLARARGQNFRDRVNSYYSQISGELPSPAESIFPEVSSEASGIEMSISEGRQLSKAEKILMKRNEIINKVHLDNEAKNRLLGEVAKGTSKVEGDTLGDLVRQLKDRESMPNIAPRPSRVSEMIGEISEKFSNNPIVKNVGTAGKIVGGILGINATDVIGNLSYDKLFKPEEKELQRF